MVAVRPPEYFPRLSYMALVQHVDRFVLADTFQYSRQSFQNRSKLRNPQGWQWISVPLEAHQHGRFIRQVRINRRDPWIAKHWRAFQYNYRSTPYFEYFEPALEPFFNRDWATLGALTCASVELVHELMGFSTPLVRASELDGAPDTLAAILTAVEGKAVLSPPDAAPHDAAVAPEIRVFRFDGPTYRQNFAGFEPGMSGADLLFNYGPETRTILTEGVRVERLGNVQHGEPLDEG